MRLHVPLLALTLAGCADDFAPYNELGEFRVLAIRAERPTLASGESTRLDAVTFEPDPALPVGVSWSWCPVTLGQDREFECAVTEAELQAQIDAVVGPGLVTVPSFSLGTTSSTSFAYSVPPALFQGLCDALKRVDLPSFVPALRCEVYFPATIRAVFTRADARIVAVKDLRLLYSADEPRNQNPTLGALTVRKKGAPVADARPLDPADPPLLERGVEHTLSVVIPPESAETYLTLPDSGQPPLVSRREVLVTTWFVEGGETESTRTTFIDGELSLEVAGENGFTPPKTVDYPASTLAVVLVVRDGRGGIGTTRGLVRLGATP